MKKEAKKAIIIGVAAGFGYYVAGVTGLLLMSMIAITVL